MASPPAVVADFHRYVVGGDTQLRHRRRTAGDLNGVLISAESTGADGTVLGDVLVTPRMPEAAEILETPS